MLPVTIGIRTILTRFCRLLIVITLESWLLSGYLNLSPRKSVEYAAAINLLAEIVGIMSFFIIKGVIPDFVQKDFIVYLLVGETPQLSLTLLLITMVYFLLYLAIKVNGFALYKFLCEIPPQQDKPDPKKSQSPLIFSMSQETQIIIRSLVRAHTISYVCIIALTVLQANEVSS